jgi:hypothetical protein
MYVCMCVRLQSYSSKTTQLNIHTSFWRDRFVWVWNRKPANFKKLLTRRSPVVTADFAVFAARV